MSTQAERIAALETQVAQLTAALGDVQSHVKTYIDALSIEVVRAHGRIDHAAKLFKAISAATQPPAATRVARGAWDSALASLRAEAGAPDAGFPKEAVLRRAAELAAH